MLKFINFLCKSTKNLEDCSDFQTLSCQFLPKEEPIHFDTLINYKHPQSGDNILHYAAKSGNLALLELIANSLDQENLINFFNSPNKDGKNALHEV
jgi:hypothetical protein